MINKRPELIERIADEMASIKRAIATSHGHAIPKGLPTRAQFGILFHLAHEGPMHLKDIAQRLHMTSSAATQLVDGLVKDKLLTRTEDTKDRRKIRLALTPLGKRTLVRTRTHHLTAFEGMLKPLSLTELNELHRILQKIHPNRS